MTDETVPMVGNSAPLAETRPLRKPDMSDDLKERTTDAMMRLPRYAKLAALMATDPRVPPVAKVALTAGGAYMISPIDLVPGVIPVAGQVDDLIVVLMAIRFAIHQTPHDAVQPLLKRSKVSIDDLDADIATVRDDVVWVARKGMTGAWKLTKSAVRRIPVSDLRRSATDAARRRLANRKLHPGEDATASD